MKTAPKLSVFLADANTNRAMDTIVAAWRGAIGSDPTDSDPQANANVRVVLLHNVYDKLAELLAEEVTPEEDEDEDDEEEDDSVEAEEADDEYASVFQELAAKKRGGNPKMSAFYKAFMGKMRDLVEPWHEDREKFLKLWAEVGNDTVAKSPAKKLKVEKILTLMKAKDAPSIEEAAAMPQNLLAGLRTLGFQHTTNTSKVSVWELHGEPLAAGYRVSVMRDTSDMGSPYHIGLYSNVQRVADKGVIERHRILTADSSVEDVMHTINKMIGAAGET